MLVRLSQPYKAHLPILVILFGKFILLVIYLTLSGIKSNIENDNIMVAEIDKNKGIYFVLFNFGINISNDPKNVPKPAKIDNISDNLIFILKNMKKR